MEGKPVQNATPGTQPTAPGKDEGSAVEDSLYGGSVTDQREVDHLKHQLEKKEVNLKAVQKQVQNLENYFDQQNDQKNPKASANEKKDL